MTDVTSTQEALENTHIKDSQPVAEKDNVPPVKSKSKKKRKRIRI